MINGGGIITKVRKKFSIIMSAYNAEKYIDAAIDSVMNQEFLDYEFIIVNDASTDSTLEKIRKYKNIKLINNEKNFGLGKSRNLAVTEAIGDYILYLDSDDTIYDKDTLKKIDNLIKQDQYDVIYLGVQYVGGSNKLYLPTKENSSKEARITCDMHFAVSSKCYRREFLLENQIEFAEGIYYEDMIYSLKTTILANKTTYGEFPFYHYHRDREGTIMSTPKLKSCVDMYYMLAKVMELYEITPEKYQPYLISFIKNETASVSEKIDIILNCMKNGGNTPVFPKRDYKFVN